jgi:hypothetical protein
VLAKLAAGLALVAFLPVILISAAAGSVGVPVDPMASAPMCRPSGRQASPAPSAASATGRAQTSTGPCQAGELEGMLLTDPRIRLEPAARGDVASGLVDHRVLQVLLFLAEHHDLNSVGPLISGHSYFVRGTTRPSNHVFGRAVDISVIDGVPVSIANPAALDAMELVLSLPPPFLPDELGGPWLLYHLAVRIFTRDHGDHIHIGWDG